MKRNMSIFSKFLIPYVIILLLSIIAYAFLYNEMISVVEKQVIESNRNVLFQGSKIMDEHMIRIENIASDFFLDPQINAIKQIKEPTSGNKVMKLIDAQKNLIEFENQDALIMNGFVAFEKSEIIFNRSNIYEIEQFFDNYVVDEVYTNDEWQRILFGPNYWQTYSPSRKIEYYEEQKDVMFCYYSISYTKESKGTIIFLLDKEKILELFKTLRENSDSYLYILNPQGELLLSSDTSINEISLDRIKDVIGNVEVNINDKEMLVSSIDSSYSGWRYGVIQPIKTITKQLEGYKRIAWTIALSYILFGVMFAIILAYKTSAPIREMISVLNNSQLESESKKKNIKLLKDIFKNALVDNKSMRHVIENHKPYLLNDFLAKIIYGTFSDSQDLWTLLEYIENDFVSKFYAISLLYFYHDEEDAQMELIKTEISKIFIDKISKDKMDQMVNTYSVANNKIVIIHSLKVKDLKIAEAYRNRDVQVICNEIAKKFSNKIIITKGSIVDCLEDINVSYSQANQSVYRAIWQNQSGVYDMSYVHEKGMLIIPFNMQNYLQSLIVEGSAKELEEYIYDIYKKQINNRAIDRYAIAVFISNLFCEIQKVFRVMGEVVFEDYSQIQKLFMENSTTKDYNYVIKELIDACKKCIESRHLKNVSYVTDIDDMLRFIDDHYYEYDFSLAQLSEKFHFTQQYCSQFFKNHTGENFQDYLVHKRMTYAKKLLAQTNMTIEEIAKKVGYSTSSTFARAFKRICKKSASKYRVDKRKNEQ